MNGTNNPIFEILNSFTQDSSTHTPSYAINEGLGTPNIHKVYIYRTINNTTTYTGRARSLQSKGLAKSIKK
jgi:hypothetical protein